jgi:hypothetical protein
VQDIVAERDRARELLASTVAQCEAHLQARLVAEQSVREMEHLCFDQSSDAAMQMMRAEKAEAQRDEALKSRAESDECRWRYAKERDEARKQVEALELSLAECGDEHAHFKACMVDAERERDEARAQVAALSEAGRAILHWYDDDSSQFNRDTAIGALRAALAAPPAPKPEGRYICHRCSADLFDGAQEQEEAPKPATEYDRMKADFERMRAAEAAKYRAGWLSPEAVARVRSIVADMAKALNNVGVLCGSDSSEPGSRRREQQVGEIYRRWNIEEPRMREALALLDGAK